MTRFSRWRSPWPRRRRLPRRQGRQRQSQKKEEGGFEFDFQQLLSVFWTGIIIYSFGSAFIGLATGRLQDRSGGDFTAYDFFDNIFQFREWDIEYSLGFDPVKVFNSWTGKGAPPAA